MIGVAGQCSAGGGSTCQNREYMGAAWHPTAQTDMQALQARFDRSSDGKLTVADTDFAKCKVMVTGANGSTSVQTLAAPGITEIELIEDEARVVLADAKIKHSECVV